MSETKKSAAEASILDAVETAAQTVAKIATDAIDAARDAAEAKKAARIAEAEVQVARFNAMYDQYRNSPLITKQRLFYETMENVLPGTKVIITDGGTQTMLPLESFAGAPEKEEQTNE